MSLPKIIHAVEPTLSAADLQLAESTAEYLREHHPSVLLDPIFHDLATPRVGARPALHCDDFTEIMRPPQSPGYVFFQERARLRAVEGDSIAASFPVNTAYDNFCSTTLGLGKVRWLCPRGSPRPTGTVDPHRLAEACWEDRQVRRSLVHAIRHEGLRYIHPHYGTKAIWQLALLLHHASRMPVHVIGAPPGLSAFVNDKGRFAALVEHMYGPAAIPPTEVVWNTALAAEQMRELCSHRKRVSVKLPSAAGGQGNLVFNSDALRGRSLARLREILWQSLPRLGYQNGDELVVSVWEENALAAPSTQYWIPPAGDGPPILEGHFMQFIVGSAGRFSGCAPADLPHEIRRRAEIRCGIVARAFQKLGYVGRCSFDLLWVGKSQETAELQFIECNGRWGGTSLPMTLMNRIFGDWHRQPFAVNTVHVVGAGLVGYQELTRRLGNRRFEGRRDLDQLVTGKIILLDPERVKRCDEVTAIVLADSWEAAIQDAQSQFPILIQHVVDGAIRGSRLAPLV